MLRGGTVVSFIWTECIELETFKYDTINADGIIYFTFCKVTYVMREGYFVISECRTYCALKSPFFSVLKHACVKKDDDSLVSGYNALWTALLRASMQAGLNKVH